MLLLLWKSFTWNYIQVYVLNPVLSSVIVEYSLRFDINFTNFLKVNKSPNTFIGRDIKCRQMWDNSHGSLRIYFWLFLFSVERHTWRCWRTWVLRTAWVYCCTVCWSTRSWFIHCDQQCWPGLWRRWLG